MNKKRNGTVCLLGAGASTDAGYPLASGLLKIYKDLLQQIDNGAFYVAPEPSLDIKEFSLNSIFERLWIYYLNTTEGGSDYLEDFFAFYDDPHNVGIAFAKEWGIQARYFEEKCLRNLRSIAINLAYKELGVYKKEAADYLRPLFTLHGPNMQASVIATLNFDFAVEQQAQLASYKLYDGFRKNVKLKAPLEWNHDKLQSLLLRWNHISKIGDDFSGFNKFPKDHHLLLKLHGSIGWYALEEGSDWIGKNQIQRHNPVYRYFRIPCQRFYEEELTNDDQILLVEKYGDGTLTRKAGALWMNPQIAYARAYKANPDSLTLELLRTFSTLVGTAETLVTIGYSWSDAHINDLILSGVAKGARLVHIGMDYLPENIIRLWRQKFRTTFEHIKRRLFVFGGGAKSSIMESKVMLPTGESIKIDIVKTINDGLSTELSLYAKLPNINLEDSPQSPLLMRIPLKK